MSYELIYVEIDINVCDLEYGVGDCDAELGVTGDIKCFNTRSSGAHDCQDPANFSPSTKTLRFGLRDSGNLPADIDCIPLLKDAKVTGGRINPGEDYGTRKIMTADFFNGRHSDAGIDPYYDERAYIATDRGTFWGKFRARNTYLEGRAIRIYEGYLGQTLAEMDCRHFLIDKMVGPDSQGKTQIFASDFLKQLNSEKALCPIPSNGILDGDYSSGAPSVTLEPAGVGDEEYPTSGRVAIGKEVFDFTRSAASDTLSLTPNLGVDHKAGEVAQQTALFTAQSPALIAETLITDYSPLDSNYTDGAAWKEKIDEVDTSNFSREVVKPTATRKLFNELIQQVGLVTYADTRLNKLSLDILRPNPATSGTVNEINIEADSFSQSDQPEKRYDNVIVYYDKRDVFSSDDPESYYSATAYLSGDIQYPTVNNKIIYSQWIPAAGFTAASRVAKRAAARYKFPPRSFDFKSFSKSLTLGEVFPLSHPIVEDATGGNGVLNAIVTLANPSPTVKKYSAEEYNIDPDLFEGDYYIPFDKDDYNINLRDEYDAQFGSLDTGSGAPGVIFVVRAGVVIGSSSTSNPAIIDGDWPMGFTPKLVVESGAYVVGMGGRGAFGDFSGLDGGGAIMVDSSLDIDNNGTIGGGGGGGAGDEFTTGMSPAAQYISGGGGAGRNIGIRGGIDADNGTLTTGGSGGAGSSNKGGDLGEDGGDYFLQSGGSAGYAINGVSKVTFTNAGTILGAQIG